MRELADEEGITPQGLTKRFKVFALTVPTMGYGEVIAEHFATYIVEADEKLEQAPSMVDIARAQHECRFRRMDFERKCPDKYGPKQEIKADNSLNISIRDFRQQNQQVTRVFNAQSAEVVNVRTNNDTLGHPVSD